MQHAGYIRAEDPSRPVHYEGGGFTTPATDIICPMYARVAQIESFAAMAPESERRPGVEPQTCGRAHLHTPWRTSRQVGQDNRRVLSAMLNVILYLQAYCANMRIQWGTAPATLRSTGIALSACRKHRWASPSGFVTESISISVQYPACSTHSIVHTARRCIVSVPPHRSWSKLQGGFIWDWVDQGLLTDAKAPGDGRMAVGWGYGE